MLQWAKNVHEKAINNIKEAQKKQKKTYDAKHKRPNFKVGDMVWQYNCRKRTRQGGKLEYNWEGPYKIIEHTSRGTYKLENKFGKVLARAISSINLKLLQQENVC